MNSRCLRLTVYVSYSQSFPLILIPSEQSADSTRRVFLERSVLWGTGFPLAFLLMSLYFARLAIHKVRSSIDLPSLRWTIADQLERSSRLSSLLPLLKSSRPSSLSVRSPLISPLSYLTKLILVRASQVPAVKEPSPSSNSPPSSSTSLELPTDWDSICSPSRKERLLLWPSTLVPFRESFSLLFSYRFSFPQTRRESY